MCRKTVFPLGLVLGFQRSGPRVRGQDSPRGIKAASVSPSCLWGLPARAPRIPSERLVLGTPGTEVFPHLEAPTFRPTGPPQPQPRPLGPALGCLDLLCPGADCTPGHGSLPSTVPGRGHPCAAWSGTFREPRSPECLFTCQGLAGQWLKKPKAEFSPLEPPQAPTTPGARGQWSVSWMVTKGGSRVGSRGLHSNPALRSQAGRVTPGPCPMPMGLGGARR